MPENSESWVGTEDRARQVTYAIGVTRVTEDVNNPEDMGLEVH